MKSSHVTSVSNQDATSGGDGWGFEDSDWGSFGTQPSTKSAEGGVSSQSKQELLQKKEGREAS